MRLTKAQIKALEYTRMKGGTFVYNDHRSVSKLALTSLVSKGLLVRSTLEHPQPITIKGEKFVVVGDRYTITDEGRTHAH